jgi:hypothetical protein
MTSFSKIYANGCSFMWGHHHNNPWLFKYFEETKDIDISSFLNECEKHNKFKENTQYTNPNVFEPFNEFNWVREKYNYVNRVAEFFKVPLINESMFGGSLHRLVRKTVTHIMNTSDEELKSTLFVLELPPPGRGEMYFENQNRYCNFAGENNFDFIENENFKLIQNWYDKSFNIQMDIINEYQKLYLLLNLLNSKNINYVFIQTSLESTNRINQLKSLNPKYGKLISFKRIESDILKYSVKFDETYDVVHWFSTEQKAKFSDDTEGVSFDGHNSIRGSRLISEKIVDYIKNKF